MFARQTYRFAPRSRMSLGMGRGKLWVSVSLKLSLSELTGLSLSLRGFALRSKFEVGRLGNYCF
jgi:hypothetical protein